MERIKIRDLPKDQKVSEKEVKLVLGGSGADWCPPWEMYPDPFPLYEQQYQGSTWRYSRYNFYHMKASI